MSEERPQPNPQASGEATELEQSQVQQNQTGEEGQQPQQQPAGEATETPPERMDWRDRRIGEQQQRLRDRNARIAALEAQLQQFQQPQQQQGQQPQPAATPPGDLQQQINAAARQLATQQEFTRRCNEAAEAGRRVYQNFDSRVQRLTGLVDSNDPQQVEAYNSFLNAAMETGQASKLIFDLGGDLNEASRIMAMSPIKMAVELARLSIRPGTEASGAPRPINPVATLGQNNRAPIHPDDPEQSDTLDTAEWMRRREEQIATRRQRTLG